MYRPSDLLPAVARVALEFDGNDIAEWRDVPPHGLSAIARDSLLNGNEHRAQRHVTSNDVLKLVSVFNNTYDRDPRGGIHPVLSRHAFEQFSYQDFSIGTMARTVLVIDQLLADAKTHFTPEELTEWLGGPVDAVMRALQIISAWVHKDGGVWTPRTADDIWRWASDEPPIVEMLRETPPDLIRKVAERCTLSQSGFKRQYPHESVELHERRWVANPLHVYPLIRLPDGRVVAPQPRDIVQSGRLGNLVSFIPSDRRGRFNYELGGAIERYVGELMQDIEGAGVAPEVVYGPNGEKSADWFLVLPDLLVLVEVKAFRPTLRVMIAARDYEDDFELRFAKAAGQIASTSGLLDDDAAFSHLPTHLRRIGLIVTGEPFYLSNQKFVQNHQRSTPIPTLVGSLVDMERLTSHPATEVAAALAAVAVDDERSSWNLGNALNGRLPSRNRFGRLLQRVADTRMHLIDIDGVGDVRPTSKRPDTTITTQ